MNSIHRIGVTIASFATVATVAGAFVIQGYVAGQQAEQAIAQVKAPMTPQLIYVNPVPTPQPPPPAQQPQVIHIVVAGYGDDGGPDG
ncbi:MAG: hypothetical protein ABSD62_04115 [Candidatus Limnocylindrales bacterium]|jgi:hypothetical protein